MTADTWHNAAWITCLCGPCVRVMTSSFCRGTLFVCLLVGTWLKNCVLMFERISTAWRNLVPNGLWGFGLSRAALNLSYHLYYWRMSRILYSFLLLSIFSRSFGDHVFIGIPNGGQWGEWGTVEWCPCGYHAKGFSLKVEEKQKAEDDTALNGIRLHCLNKTEKVRNPRTEYLITSTESPWGVWSPTLWCPEGHLIRFSMQVEPPRKGVDDTAANNVMFQCSDYEILFGPGQSWGHYGRWSGKCMDGICGIKTKVESPQGSGDDTALNDVQFICCRS